MSRDCQVFFCVLWKIIGDGAAKVLTTGRLSTIIGSQAAYSLTIGQRNVVIGRQALYDAVEVGENIIIGYEAAKEQNAGGSDGTYTATYNTVIGYKAAEYNETGTRNTWLGHYAGRGASGESNSDNVGIGTNALTAITTGGNNIAIGREAGDLITTAGTNVLIGRDAGDDIVGGGSNICIGYQARAGNASRTNGIVIGYAISAGGDNDFSFGKASNVVTNDFDADADWSRSSDARLKRNVQDTSLGLDFVNDLRPVKFQWKPSNEVPKELTSEYNEENQKNLDYVSHGFIAQEVKEVVDKHGDSSFGVWQLDGDGETQRIKKNMLVMPLIKAVQELSEKVVELEKKLEEKDK